MRPPTQSGRVSTKSLTSWPSLFPSHKGGAAIVRQHLCDRAQFRWRVLAGCPNGLSESLNDGNRAARCRGFVSRADLLLAFVAISVHASPGGSVAGGDVPPPREPVPTRLEQPIGRPELGGGGRSDHVESRDGGRVRMLGIPSTSLHGRTPNIQEATTYLNRKEGGGQARRLGCEAPRLRPESPRHGQSMDRPS